MNIIADFYQLGLTDVCNNGKTVKQYLGKNFVHFCQNNYIRTNLVGVLAKNEASEVHDLDVYFEVYKLQNHLKILNSQKLSCLVCFFGLKSFHEFVNLAQLEDVTDCPSSLLLCIIVLFFMAGSCKTFKKHQYPLTRTQLSNIT